MTGANSKNDGPINVPAADNQATRIRQQMAFGLFVLSALIVIAFTIWWFVIRVPETLVLKVGAGPYRSDSYELMVEMAKVVDRHAKGIKLEIIATSDSSQNISRLNGSHIDLATIRSDTPVVSDVRLVAQLFPDFFQLIARSDAGISKVSDLIGKRIAIPPFGTDEFRSFWIVGDHYDLPIEGMDWRPMPLLEAKEQLLAGNVDVIFTVRSLRDRLLLNLFEDATLKSMRLNFIGLDQAEAIALKRPFIQVSTIPVGAFIGAMPTPRAKITTAIVNRVLVSREEIPSSAIHELTRVLFEHRLDLIIRFALASAVVRPQTDIGISVPLHEGAEQYFNRDQPSFIQENAEPIALVITVFAMMFSGLLTLRNRLGNTQKNRMDSYNYMLLALAEQAHLAQDAEQVKKLKTQMFEVLETVVKALDTDEVTEDGFQSFSLLWESVREVMNERAAELRST